MNKVYIARVLKNTNLVDFQKNFCSLRNEYIDKIKNVERKKQSIAVWALLLKACEKFFPNVQPDFQVDEKGKWFDNSGSIKFSLTHCKEFVAVSISDNITAIDIEEVTKRALFLQNCSYLDCEREISQLNEYELTVLWTEKECAIKSSVDNPRCRNIDLNIDDNKFVLSVYFEKGEFDIDKDLVKCEL